MHNSLLQMNNQELNIAMHAYSKVSSIAFHKLPALLDIGLQSNENAPVRHRSKVSPDSIQ